MVLVGTALLLVSTLPVWSFKNFKVPAEYVLPLLLGTGVYRRAVWWPIPGRRWPRPG